MNSKSSSWSSSSSGLYAQIDPSTEAVMGGTTALDNRSDLRQNLLAMNSNSSHGAKSDYVPLETRGHADQVVDIEQGASTPRGGGAGTAGDVDPFFVFKDDLLIKLKRTEDSLSHYVTLVHDTVRFFLISYQVLNSTCHIQSIFVFGLGYGR